MNHRTTSLSPAAQFKTHLPTFKNKSTKSHKLGFQNDYVVSLALSSEPFSHWLKPQPIKNHFETLQDLRKLRNYQHDPMARDLKMNSGHPISDNNMAIRKHIVIIILILTTWIHLKSQKKRKFKAAEEVKSKRPDKNVDDSRPDMKGKIGCNACCLYWALHGVSFCRETTHLLNRFSK